LSSAFIGRKETNKDTQNKYDEINKKSLSNVIHTKHQQYDAEKITFFRLKEELGLPNCISLTISIGLGGGVAGVIELRTAVGFSLIAGKLNFLRSSFFRSNASSKLPKLNLNKPNDMNFNH
jgi:hypothetical protein